ncbi:flagellar hook-length control protein FliK [Stenotrophomonas sp. AB1(2024)]|uniref:flagellar hook-length control protein FliK n=1 Tax=Stenotrophomonas sp. AB1(2024) TaxID=3132215 RepID=UPI0030AB7DE4
MPPSLLGSSAGPTAGSSAPPASRSNASGSDSDRRDFDALLKTDSGSKEAPAKTTADKPTTADTGGNAAGDAKRRPASDEATDAADPAAAPATAATEKTTTSEPTDDTDAAPWPPLGLAGLALAGLEPVTVMAAPAPAPAPAASADAAALAKADPAPPTLPTATTTPATPALPGATAATDSSPAAIALPLDAEVAEDTPLPKALTDAIANAGGDTDAPTTPLLHALHAAAELKAAATASTPFQGDPTATPHVGGDDFDDAVSARIGWLADQKIGHATIKVTPHDLGQIEVRLQMDGDKVHASFSSAHADVRHALESSIPRLREMLNEQGFQLGNADVGHQQTAQDGKANGGQPGHGTGDGDGDAALVETTISPSQLMRQRGLLDAYA